MDNSSKIFNKKKIMPLYIKIKAHKDITKYGDNQSPDDITKDPRPNSMHGSVRVCIIVDDILITATFLI